MSVETLYPCMPEPETDDTAPVVTESADQFYGMIDAAPFAALFVTPEGNVDFLNEQGHEFFRRYAPVIGFGPEQIVGRPAARLYDLATELRQSAASTSKTSTRFAISDEWFDVSLSPVNGTAGTLQVWENSTEFVRTQKRALENSGQIEAIQKTQAVVEFNLDGTIITANDNFLKTMGYALQEVQGRHHRMFVEAAFAQSQEYSEFWARLNRGEVETNEYKCLGKEGREVWFQASYTPIFDCDSKPAKVVQIATEITNQIQLADDFEENVKSLVAGVTSAATVLHDNLKLLVSTTEAPVPNAQVVAADSEKATRNVETISSAAEQLSAAIAGVARHVQNASRMTKQAVSEAERANVTILELGESSREIGDVMTVMTSIAQQTKLLALNATIEATRAGEAGKGFAVVAGEVKELSGQIARVAEEISQKIDAFQSTTCGAALAIQTIGDRIGKVDEISTTIASAVEEQAAANSEIARNVIEAVKETAEISDHIADSSQAADEGDRNVGEMLSALDGLARESVQLDTVTTEFLKRLRDR